MGGPTVSIPTPTGTPTESPSQQPENTAQEGNGNDKVQEGEKAQSTDVQTNTDAPKHTNAYDGAWGKVKYFLFGGIEGMGQYDINGNLIGPAPITGMAPTPNFKGGSNVLKWSKVMKGKDVVKMLEKIGFKQVGQKGSHVQLKLFGIGPKVTVPVHGSNTLAPGTLKSIIKQVEEAINSIH
jgi:predicted RNA binding protein YcfA (HicA-like mRNA interferase family)